MRFVITGHLCLDVIHLPDGSEVQSYGGIFFSLASLANIADEDDLIYPVFGVGEVDYDKFIERISKYENVVRDGIFKFPGLTNRVHLFYQDRNERTECSVHIAKPIEYKRFENFKNADGIFINMISGFDITLDTLKKLRKLFPYIHFDVHSLTLGVDEKNIRFRKKLENWDEWLSNVDTVQMNEHETRAMGDESWTDERLAEEVLNLGVKAMVVTRGPDGATLFYRKDKLIKIDFPAIDIEPIDPTGCGDVFGSAFFLKYAKTSDPVEAVKFANLVAGLNATIRGSTEIDKLKELVKK